MFNTGCHRIAAPSAQDFGSNCWSNHTRTRPWNIHNVWQFAMMFQNFQSYYLSMACSISILQRSWDQQLACLLNTGTSTNSISLPFPCNALEPNGRLAIHRFLTLILVYGFWEINRRWSFISVNKFCTDGMFCISSPHYWTFEHFEPAEGFHPSLTCCSFTFLLNFVIWRDLPLLTNHVPFRYNGGLITLCCSKGSWALWRFCGIPKIWIVKAGRLLWSANSTALHGRLCQLMSVLLSWFLVFRLKLSKDDWRRCVCTNPRIDFEAQQAKLRHSHPFRFDPICKKTFLSAFPCFSWIRWHQSFALCECHADIEPIVSRTRNSCSQPQLDRGFGV